MKVFRMHIGKETFMNVNQITNVNGNKTHDNRLETVYTYFRITNTQ